MIEWIQQWMMDNGIGGNVAPYLANGVAVVLILFLGLVADLFVKKVALNIVIRYIKKSRVKWDDILLERKVFQRLSHLAPAIVIHMFSGAFSAYQEWIQRIAFSYMVLVTMMIISALLDAADDYYRYFEVSKDKPIKGYLQVVKIFIYIIGTIIIIGILIDRSPWLLLSGIGALSAVVMLVFHDSILGFVAGIQLSANNMVRIGDWIEMSKYDADGDVIDVSLNTVKVRNWDKTITTIPTYALISQSFKNWRGMHETGGRRIKRAIYIDMTSIRFCTEEMLERFKKIQYISEYIDGKIKEVEAYNKEHNVDTSSIVNGRRLTNIGTFRAYVEAYIKNHPRIHKNLINLVRQLPPTENGLPIEIYAFTNDTAWVNYEAIQADIFDHILAIVPEFDLRVFQSPAGHNFQSIWAGGKDFNQPK